MDVKVSFLNVDLNEETQAGQYGGHTHTHTHRICSLS